MISKKEYAFQNNFLVYKNNLLGYYNTQNVYIINDEIVQNLLEQEKTIVKQEGNKYYCSCYLQGFGSIDFEVEFDMVDKENAICNLYLIENMNMINGYIRHPIKTLIGQYQNKFDDDFFKKMIYAFKLVQDSDVMKRPKIEDINKSYIYNRKNYNEKLYIQQSQGYNKIFKDLVDTQLKYLSNNKSAFCKEVSKMFSEKQKSLSQYLKINNKVDYFALYELLTLCAEECVLRNPNYKQEQLDFAKQMQVAVTFAIKQAKELSNKFIVQQTKEIKKSGNEEELAAFDKVMNNKKQIKSNESDHYRNSFLFGNVSGFNRLEVNSLQQLRAYNSGSYKEFLNLKTVEEYSFTNKVMDFVEKVGNGIREAVGLDKKDFDGDGKIETFSTATPVAQDWTFGKTSEMEAQTPVVTPYMANNLEESSSSDEIEPYMDEQRVYDETAEAESYDDGMELNP